jgi:hypothetical protein
VITLRDVKADLRVRHDHDDELILRLIEGATDECLRFMNRLDLPVIPDQGESPSGDDDSDDPWVGVGVLPPSVRSAVFLLVQAGYDRMKPDEVQLRRNRAESLCMPYRKGLGV